MTNSTQDTAARMPPQMGHAETRGERIADWFMFAVEVYLLLAVTGFVGLGLLGFLQTDDNATNIFRFAFLIGLLFPLIVRWVFADFRAMRSGLRALKAKAAQ